MTLLLIALGMTAYILLAIPVAVSFASFLSDKESEKILKINRN